MTSQIFAGVDEVGRGCLAGPVVSVAIILEKSIDRRVMVDSKKISHKKRVELSQYILRHARSIGVGICDNHIIDKINIHNATLESMKKAIINLDLIPEIAYIDGKFIPNTDIKCKSIIKGDEKIPQISAASIIAKVTRDKLIKKMSKKFTKYAWDKNAGYGTKFHLEAIKKFGITIYHRKKFGPIHNILSPN